MGLRNHQKKSQAPIHPEDPFSVGVPMPGPNMVKYGQKSTFDRKVVETQFFYQNDQNEVLKIFILVWSHFALKCFLKWLIGQLEILWRINQDFTVLTPV